MKKLVGLSLAILLLAAACNKNSNVEGTNTNTTPLPVAETPAPTPPPTPEALSGTVDVNLTATGLTTPNITVKSGTVVVFKNMSTKNWWPASDPHPSHTDLTGFDAKKALKTGESYSFTFTKVGKWGYHDHLSPTSRGSVTVVE